MTNDAFAAAVESHRRWLAGASGGARLVMRRIRLEGIDLRGASLRWAGLGYASLAGGDLRDVDLSGADLRFADLSRCDVRGGTLRDADLRYSALSGADLSSTTLIGARLTDALLDGITVNWTDRTLVGEILWRAAGDDTTRRMIAAFIARETTWCWERFLAVPTPERAWALGELRRWSKEGDGAPSLLFAQSDTGWR